MKSKIVQNTIKERLDYLLAEFDNANEISEKQKTVRRSTRLKIKPNIPPLQLPVAKSTFHRNKQVQHNMKLRRHERTFRPFLGTKFKPMAAQHKFNKKNSCKMFRIYDDNGGKMNVDKLLKTESQIWSESVSNELGRLAQGISNVKGNDAIEFIPKSEVPLKTKVTYANMVCDIRPKKSDVYRTRLTIGGDKLDYHDNSTSPAASLIDTKILINSVVSDAKSGARFPTIDIIDYFLQSTLPVAEYMRIHSKYFFC